MSLTRFKIAKKDIVKLFESNGPRAYTYSDISKILSENMSYWRLPVNTSTGNFIQLLVDNTVIKVHSFDFPVRTIHRYTWGEVPTLQLALSLEKDSYLSHYAALYIHGITDQIPKKIYITYEQPWKNTSKGTLKQIDIDSSFMKSPRLSSNIAEYGDYSICLLNGQFTNKLGVTLTGNLSVTSIERTLIDAVVRPSYSGGIPEVLIAFKKAAGTVSINKLVAMLKKLSFVYPYHQAIGFYMEKSGAYNNTQMQLLKNFDFKFDFYITHQMQEKDYSKEWKLYYPKGF